MRYVLWFKFGTKTWLKNFVNAVTIGVTHPRWVWIFDFIHKINFLYIWFSSSSQSSLHLSTRLPPISKWLILSKKIGRSFKWFPTDSNKVSRSNKHFASASTKSYIVRSSPVEYFNFVQSLETIGKRSIKDTKHICFW